MNLEDISQKSPQALNYYIGLLRRMSMIDGELDENEAAFLAQQCTRLGVELTEDKAAELDRSMGDDDLEEPYNVLVQQKLHYSFLMDLVMIAVADGVVENREREFLQKIKNRIKIPNADFHNLISFAKVTSGCHDLEEIDGGSLDILERFYRWAGQSQIPLYTQTGFSLSPTVDEQLKQIYQELEIGDD